MHDMLEALLSRSVSHDGFMDAPDESQPNNLCYTLMPQSASRGPSCIARVADVKRFRRPHKHKDPRNQGVWNPPCLGPWNQNVGSLCVFGLWGVPHAAACGKDVMSPELRVDGKAGAWIVQ